MKKRLKKLGMFTMLASVMVFGAACSDGEKSAETTNGNDSQLEGSIAIDGSGTVYPFMAKMAENYMTNEQENVSVEVSRAGTSAGFKKFLEKDGTDYNDASRQIKDEEKAESGRAWNRSKRNESCIRWHHDCH